jgi:plasmid stabilization system protein ParE
MALRVRWNKRAEKSFAKIIDYLELNFGERTTKNFVLRTFPIIDSLSEYPEIGTEELKEKNVRGFVITKHNILFYRYTQRELILLNFFDTRQNPKKKIVKKWTRS